MYHTIIPVLDDYNPIVVEGNIETQVLIFNAGPSVIQVKAWNNWEGKKNGFYSDEEPNFSLELRAGNERIVSGSMIRVSIMDKRNSSNSFAAIGTLVINQKK